MRLFYLSLSWIAGICLGVWAGSYLLVFAVIAGYVIIALMLRRGHLALLLLCLIAIAAGYLRYESTISPADEGVLSYYNDTGPVTITGLVASDPETADSSIVLRLEARELEVDGGSREVSGAVQVYAPLFLSPESLPPDAAREPPYYRYGDVLRIEGEIRTPPEFEDFDWRDYLARQGIHSVINYPQRMEITAVGQGFKPQEWIYGLRDRMSRSLEGSLHEPQASLAQAVLLGKRSAVPDDLRDSMAESGTAHILAVSGIHIFIVGGAAASFGVWVFGRRRPTWFLLGLGIIWAYALLTGMHAPVLRAVIMGTLWLVAIYIGRPASSMTWLLFAAAIMTGLSPSIIGSVSFQMSFAAMAGIILLYSHFQSLGRRVFRIAEGSRTARGFFVDSLSITSGAVIATIPILAYHFHQVSLVALPANLAALPALPGAIIITALVAVVGIFAPPLAAVLGWVSWLFISYIIEVAELFSVLPFASLQLENVGASFVWGYYAILGAGLWAAANRSRMGTIMGRVRIYTSSALEFFRRVPARIVVVPLLVIAALVWTAAVTAPDDRLHVFFLDVGQGDAVLIQRGHQQVLIDGGADGGSICRELGDRLPYWDHTLELVILTHADADHVTGMVEVLRRYDVDRVLAGGNGGGSAVYDEWLSQVDRQDISCTGACSGQRVMLADDLFLEVLHPGKELLEGTDSDVNNNSVVARLVYRDFSLLLTGDIFEEAEGYLLDRRCNLSSTALKVPHHGSDTSCCAGFLGAVGPQLAVISVGEGNRFGHPAPDVVERLNDAVGEDSLYLTSENGTVELITDGERLWVRTEK